MLTLEKIYRMYYNNGLQDKIVVRKGDNYKLVKPDDMFDNIMSGGTVRSYASKNGKLYRVIERTTDFPIWEEITKE